MENKKNEDQQLRKHVLAVKITVKEKEELAEYSSRRCVNLSGLARQLLFDHVRRDKP